MPGTFIGGAKAAITNKQKHGEDFYARIGRKGGLKRGIEKGFGIGTICSCEIYDYQPHKKAQCAGKIGGKNSKRGPNKPKEDSNV